MAQKENQSLPEKIYLLFSSPRFRFLLIALLFLSFVFTRNAVGKFNFLLGYLYLTLICFSGFWFGMTGGVLAAAAASLIFILEANFYRYWAFRDIVLQTISFRIMFYFLGGISMGYLSSSERRLKNQLKSLAYYDELTGCVNFRWTMHLLQNELARAVRYKKEVTVVMIDLDFFKKINDTYGHPVGNEVLSEFSSIIKDSVRNVDTVGRYGGEEFLIILPGASVPQSLAVLERIKQRLRSVPLSSRKLDIRFSAGIASFPYNAGSIHELLTIVDNSLYQAKKTGRDKIVIERRRWFREKPDKPLQIQIIDPVTNKELIPLEVSNISKGGALLSLPRVSAKKEILCRIYLPGEKYPYEFSCEIKHKKRIDKDKYSIGMFFNDISPSNQEKLFKTFKPLRETLMV